MGESFVTEHRFGPGLVVVRARTVGAAVHAFVRVHPTVKIVIVHVGVGQNLPARRGTLARRDDRVGEKEFPHAKQTFARQCFTFGVNVAGQDRRFAAHPVVVPFVKGVGVVASNLFHGLDREPRQFKLTNVPIQRRRGVGARKDVFVHEQTPRDVFPVGPLSQTGHLHQEGAFRFGGHAFPNLFQVRVDKIVQTHVFGHFNRSDFIKTAVGRNVAVIHV